MASHFPDPLYTSGRQHNASLMNNPRSQPFTELAAYNEISHLPFLANWSVRLVSFPSLCCWSTQGILGYSEEALHGNLHLCPLLLWLCSCGDKSCLICKCFMWGIPKIALTFTDSTTQEQWLSTAAKAVARGVDVLLSYIEPRKTCFFFYRAEIQIYSIWNMNRLGFSS